MSSLPEPVERFVELVSWGQTPQISTLILETDAWMWRPGLPRIPLAIRMSHRLGEAFVHRIRIGRGRLSIPFGMDAYVDGHGLMRVGPSTQVGPTFDEGALIAMWGEALVFPGAWLDRRDVSWEAVDAHTARLVVSGDRGDVPLTVAFDPEGRLPALVRGRSAQGSRAAGSLDRPLEPMAPDAGGDPRSEPHGRAVGRRGPTVAGAAGDVHRAERAGRAGPGRRPSGARRATAVDACARDRRIGHR